MNRFGQTFHFFHWLLFSQNVWKAPNLGTVYHHTIQNIATMQAIT